MAYLGASLSLTALEVLVHSPRFELLKGTYVYFSLNIPDRYILSVDLKDLPSDWHQASFSTSTQFIGDVWLKDKTSLALMVPSRIIPIENNLLLNPKHPDYSNIKITGPYSFQFDERL